MADIIPLAKEKKSRYNREAHLRRWADPEIRARQIASTAALQREKISFIRAHKAVLGCATCPENDAACLDLHHRKRETKNPLLKNTAERRATPLYQLGWQAIKDELEKCDVLCSNCHRKLESRLKG